MRECSASTWSTNIFFTIRDPAHLLQYGKIDSTVGSKIDLLLYLSHSLKFMAQLA